MKKPSTATSAAHNNAVAELTQAADVAAFGLAFARWQQLDTPGFPDDSPDGHYLDGYFLGTIRAGELAVTQIRQLPPTTLDLWRQHDEAQRGPGQPEIGKPFPVRLTAWRRADITRDAKAAGVPDAELVRWLIAHAYDTLRREADAAGVSHTELIRQRVSRGTRTR